MALALICEYVHSLAFENHCFQVWTHLSWVWNFQTTGCAEAMTASGFSWPRKLNCDRLPRKASTALCSVQLSNLFRPPVM